MTRSMIRDWSGLSDWAGQLLAGFAVYARTDGENPSAIPVVDMNACGRSVVFLYFRKHLCTMLSNKKNNPK